MTTPKANKSDDERRDAVLLRMLKTPPKPHDEMKIGKPGGKKAKSPAKRKPELKK